MIRIFCDFCQKEMIEHECRINFFSPKKGNGSYELCEECFERILKKINEGKGNE